MPTKKSKKTTRHYRYTLVFKTSADGSYVVTVPAIGSLSVTSHTIEGAREMAGRAIRAHLEDLAVRDIAFPIERVQPITEQIEIEIDVS